MTGGKQLTFPHKKAEGCSYITRGETANTATGIEAQLLEKGKAAQGNRWELQGSPVEENLERKMSIEYSVARELCMPQEKANTCVFNSLTQNGHTYIGSYCFPFKTETNGKAKKPVICFAVSYFYTCIIIYEMLALNHHFYL